MQIDLNADLGEGAAFDRELMQLVTSANVCCGQHAGGPEEMAQTLDLANEFRVVLGAHPGYPDRAHFGRLELQLTPQELSDTLRSQILELDAMARAKGRPIAYMKPHGALYNQACRDRAIADTIVVVAEEFDLPIVALPGSRLEDAARGRVPFVAEGFADRGYRPDGSLVPRSEPNAFIHDPEAAVKQVEWLMREQGVRTICVHGDNPEAVAFGIAVRKALLDRGVKLSSFV